MEPRLSPAENARKVTAMLALMFGVVPMSFFYYSIERNVRTRNSLAKSCTVVATEVREGLDDAALARLFGDDAARIKTALEESRRAHCEDIDGELSWWMWNVKRGIALDAPNATRERLGELPESTEARCAAAFPDEAASCAARVAVVRGLLPVPSVSISAWEWASRVSAISREVASARGVPVGRFSPY